MNRDEVSLSSASVSWHALNDSEVLTRTQSCLQGLTAGEARDRLAQFGPNELPSKPPPTLLLIFAHQFLSPLIYILIVAGLVSMAIGEWTDAGFIFAVILLNAMLGTFQEWKAEHSAASLQKLLKTACRVKRDSHVQDLDAEGLVPGDIVILESGGLVPADIRLLEVHNLTIDESLLTGESQAVVKRVGVCARRSVGWCYYTGPRFWRAGGLPQAVTGCCRKATSYVHAWNMNIKSACIRICVL